MRRSWQPSPTASPVDRLGGCGRSWSSGSTSVNRKGWPAPSPQVGRAITRHDRKCRADRGLTGFARDCCADEPCARTWQGRVPGNITIPLRGDHQGSRDWDGALFRSMTCHGCERGRRCLSAVLDRASPNAECASLRVPCISAPTAPSEQLAPSLCWSSQPLRGQSSTESSIPAAMYPHRLCADSRRIVRQGPKATFLDLGLVNRSEGLCGLPGAVHFLRFRVGGCKYGDVPNVNCVQSLGGTGESL